MYVGSRVSSKRAERGQVGQTWVRLLMPRTKQIPSRMFDLPEPFRPVMALNCGSKLETTVRVP